MNSEEEVVWAHVETAHLVEAVAAHHQSDEAHASTQHLDVVNDAVNSCGRNASARKVVLLDLHLLKAFKDAFIVKESRCCC